jgi:DnaJ family protein C protein 28
MLEDSYPPLRIPGYQKKIQTPTERALEPARPEEVNATEPSKPLHPWDIQYRAPKHHIGIPSIRTGLMVPKAGSRRRFDMATKMAMARERSLDYAEGGEARPAERVTSYNRKDDVGLGSKARSKVLTPAAAPRDGLDKELDEREPTSEAQQASLTQSQIVEDRIQRAREEGLFRNLKGRGQPFQQDWNERSNPHIDSTSFLMNRIVQRQGAAPAWIELQQQVDHHLGSFRIGLRDAWTRRAVRMLSLDGPGVLTPSFINRAAHYKDEEWLRRER